MLRLHGHLLSLETKCWSRGHGGALMKASRRAQPAEIQEEGGRTTFRVRDAAASAYGVPQKGKPAIVLRLFPRGCCHSGDRLPRSARHCAAAARLFCDRATAGHYHHAGHDAELHQREFRPAHRTVKSRSSTTTAQEVGVQPSASGQRRAELREARAARAASGPVRILVGELRDLERLSRHPRGRDGHLVFRPGTPRGARAR